MLLSRFGSNRSYSSADRLWYAPTSDDAQPLYVAWIEAPHPEAIQLSEDLGDAEDLLIAKPGSPITVVVDTDLGPDKRRLMLESVSNNLTEAGFVLEDDAELTARVLCRAMKKQKVRVNMSSHPFPDPWDIVERTVTPYASSIVIERDGEELWSAGWTAKPGGFIFIQKDESLDQALARITKPNVETLCEQKFGSHLAKPGNANHTGAYGYSKLTSLGIATTRVHTPDP